MDIFKLLYISILYKLISTFKEKQKLSDIFSINYLIGGDLIMLC